MRLPAGGGWGPVWAGMQGLIEGNPGFMLLLPPADDRDAAWLRTEAEPRFRRRAVLPGGVLARPHADGTASTLLLTAW